MSIERWVMRFADSVVRVSLLLAQYRLQRAIGEL